MSSIPKLRKGLKICVETEECLQNSVLENVSTCYQVLALRSLAPCPGGAPRRRPAGAAWSASAPPVPGGFWESFDKIEGKTDITLKYGTDEKEYVFKLKKNRNVDRDLLNLIKKEGFLTKIN